MLKCYMYNLKIVTNASLQISLNKIQDGRKAGKTDCAKEEEEIGTSRKNLEMVEYLKRQLRTKKARERLEKENMRGKDNGGVNEEDQLVVTCPGKKESFRVSARGEETEEVGGKNWRHENVAGRKGPPFAKADSNNEVEDVETDEETGQTGKDSDEDEITESSYGDDKSSKENNQEKTTPSENEFNITGERLLSLKREVKRWTASVMYFKMPLLVTQKALEINKEPYKLFVKHLIEINFFKKMVGLDGKVDWTHGIYTGMWLKVARNVFKKKCRKSRTIIWVKYMICFWVSSRKVTFIIEEVTNDVFFGCKITDRAVKLGRVKMKEWMANVQKLRQDTTGSYLEFCAEALPVMVGARFFREKVQQGKKMKSFVTVECEAMALTILENVGGECIDVAQKKGGERMTDKEKVENKIALRKFTGDGKRPSTSTHIGFGETGNQFYMDQVMRLYEDRSSANNVEFEQQWLEKMGKGEVKKKKRRKEEDPSPEEQEKKTKLENWQMGTLKKLCDFSDF